MKQVRQFCAVTVLTLVLASQAFAGGGVLLGDAIPPPPAPPRAGSTGNMQSGDTDTTSITIITLIETMVGLSF